MAPWLMNSFSLGIYDLVFTRLAASDWAWGVSNDYTIMETINLPWIVLDRISKPICWRIPPCRNIPIMKITLENSLTEDNHLLF